LAFPLVSAPAAENQFALLVTLAEVEKDILEYHRLLTCSPRSDPNRPTLLGQLAVRRNHRYGLSRQKGDLDKSITHFTEAILLSFQPSQDVVHMFFQLANDLLSRFNMYKHPEDVKSSINYFRFLRINFHPLRAFGSSHGRLTSLLVSALAENLMLESGDVIQGMEEMATLIHELLCSCVSTSDLINAIVPFSEAVVKVFRHGDAKLPQQVFQVLQEAEVIKPDSRVSYALARCLAARFQTTHVINDYEEAIAIADKIIAAHSPGVTLTVTERRAISLIPVLVTSRLNSYSNPEYLEDAIRRFRTLLCLPFLPDDDRTRSAVAVDNLERRRFSNFGVTGNSGETPSDDYSTLVVMQTRVSPGEWGSAQTEEKMALLQEILATMNDETTDVEAAVERSRTLLPLQYPFSYFPTFRFAAILFLAHQRTNRLDYLNEAITTYRGLRKVSTPKVIQFHVGESLLSALIARSNLPCDLVQQIQDFEEAMQLFPELANDGSGEVIRRFQISYGWADTARIFAHSSVSTAYETAMSLIQETLLFSPTLQTQHFHLAQTFRKGEAFPSDYASYLIETGQFTQAIETLERGRALIWSELRGLRTSIDQLRVAEPALADKFSDINRRLESVTMSVAQSESEEMGDSRAGARHHEGMDSIGHLVSTQRRLLDERDTLISHIQSFPGFENFLKPPLFDILSSAAAHAGPVIIINQSQFCSYILLVLKDSLPSVISTPSDFHDRANRLKDDLLHVRKEKGLDSKDYDLTLASVLADLYELVGKPVIKRLRQLEVPEKSRVWWCPTDAFCSLPLHAMGPIPSDDGKELYFLDLYITSYTPTLSALIESRKPGSFSEKIDKLKPSLLLVAQPDTLPGAWGEIGVIQTTNIPVTTLVSAMATPETVVESLRVHRFAHFVCHGLLETGKPFDASLELHGDNLTLLDIVRSKLPAAEFAFLSACHTAELTEESIADEGLHLAAAMQYCGFRSVVGTMWAMADTDGVDLSKHFYKSIFSDKSDQNGVPHYERSARALQLAVKKLRRKRGITLERWVNFVHYGA
jgi:CHAT domain-containing protein/tetratricopeptide (TPR) repeat protein